MTGVTQPLRRSGYTRLLRHSMGILRLYEILRKVQKHLGGLGHALSAYGELMRLVIL